jgi:hypothetical protein
MKYLKKELAMRSKWNVLLILVLLFMLVGVNVAPVHADDVAFGSILVINPQTSQRVWSFVTGTQVRAIATVTGYYAGLGCSINYGDGSGDEVGLWNTDDPNNTDCYGSDHIYTSGGTFHISVSLSYGGAVIVSGATNLPVSQLVFEQLPDLSGVGALSDSGVWDTSFCTALSNECSAAENVLVPAGKTLTISHIQMWGVYIGLLQTADPDTYADEFTVVIHQNAEGLPGTPVYTEHHVKSLRILTGHLGRSIDEYLITLTLSTPQALEAGTYWIEVFNTHGTVDADGTPANVFTWLPGLVDTFGLGPNGWAQWVGSDGNHTWEPFSDAAASLSLRLFSPAAAPTTAAITLQPQNVTVGLYEAASFTSAVDGVPVPTLQWQVSTDSGATWTDIPGATASPLTINSASYAQNGYQYRAVWTNSAGQVTSSVATLTVTRYPIDVILRSSQNPSVYLNQVTISAALGTDYGSSKSGTITFYDGGATIPECPRPVQVTIMGAGCILTHLNAGTHHITAQYSGNDFFQPDTAEGSDSIFQVVNPLPATITLSGLEQVYTGTAHAVGATTAPSGLPVIITYAGSPTAPANAGSYAVVAAVSDTNYTGSATGTLTINKATATILSSLSNLSKTYTGSAITPTVTTIPSGLNVAITYPAGTALVNVGSYDFVATINDANYQGTLSGMLNIVKATATVSLSNLSQTYDGSPKPVTVTTVPAGLGVTVTYNVSGTVPSAAGSYAVVATVNDANYQGTASGTLVIAPPPPTTYISTGFTAPVDMGGVLNTANSGQMIPLKWRLLDGSGNPVTNLDPASVTLAYSTYTCSAGAPVDAIETYATGTTMLQNLGNGYYQLNWKTDKAWANTCKRLTLKIGTWTGDGLAALFQFKK